MSDDNLTHVFFLNKFLLDGTLRLHIKSGCRVIQQELVKKKDMSKIIIGHRISSVRDADEIIVLENGRIKERGTHEQLLLKRGLYYSTYEAQYGDYRKALALDA